MPNPITLYLKIKEKELKGNLIAATLCKKHIIQHRIFWSIIIILFGIIFAIIGIIVAVGVS